MPAAVDAGGSIGSPSEPYGHPPSLHPPTQPPPPPPSPPPGPAPIPWGTGTPTGGGTDILAGFSTGARSQAEQIAYDFGGFVGWPSWYDQNAMAKRILEQGLQADPVSGFQYLWALIPKDAQTANPNAFFGLTKQQYTEKLNSLADQFELYTGMAVDQIPTDLRNQAMSQNWTQSELLHHLQGSAGLMASAPWVAVGLNFRDIQSQFGNTYGHAPDGPGQLASWWKFRTGAQAVVGGGPATETFMPPPSLVQRQITADTQVR